MKTCSVASSNNISPEIFKRVVFKVCPEFKSDENNVIVLNNIYKYVNGIAGELDSKKGLLIWGSVGSGKSTIIKIVGEILRLRGEGYKTLNCSYLATQFAAYGLDALNTSTYNDGERGPNPVNRAFDELGREPIPAKHYGTDLNVMQYIIQCRYELRDTVKTFATTNLRPAALGQIYGAYIEDRITEMFNIVEMTSLSYRK